MAVAAQCPWYRDHAAGLLKVKTFLKANVSDIFIRVLRICKCDIVQLFVTSRVLKHLIQPMRLPACYVPSSAGTDCQMAYGSTYVSKQLS